VTRSVIETCAERLSPDISAPPLIIAIARRHREGGIRSRRCHSAWRPITARCRVAARPADADVPLGRRVGRRGCRRRDSWTRCGRVADREPGHCRCDVPEILIVHPGVAAVSEAVIRRSARHRTDR
jgi:hypothetical protein